MSVLAAVDVKSQEAAETITANEFKNEHAFLAESTVHVFSEIRDDLVTATQKITLDPGTTITARAVLGTERRPRYKS